MKINELLQLGYEKLKNKNVDSFLQDTELILGFILNKKREWILSNPEFIIQKKIQKRFFRLILKRAKNYPIAYILKYKYFNGLKFKVNKNVLIPRPETEILINEVLKSIQWVDGLTILDVGTGSGCISISIAKNLCDHNKTKNTKIIASDISKLAINIAKKNAKLNGVYKKIKFIKSNLLKNIGDKNIDIIVANLPYVKTSWEHESIKYEPRLALYSSKDGLSHYKKLLHQIKNLKFNPKYVFFEIDPDQTKILEDLTKKLFPKSEIQIKKDLNNLNRVFTCLPTGKIIKF